MLSGIQEKRRSPRIKLQTPLSYQTRGTPEIYHTLSGDISTGGVGFIHQGFIAPDTKLALKIDVFSHILSPVGKVVCAISLSHSDRYHLGVEFIELEAREKNYLRDYINMQRGIF